MCYILATQRMHLTKKIPKYMYYYTNKERKKENKKERKKMILTINSSPLILLLMIIIYTIELSSSLSNNNNCMEYQHSVKLKTDILTMDYVVYHCHDNNDLCLKAKLVLYNHNS